ncbi:hypothetical protein LCGC14_2978400, partial [marine sediment metagenome]
EDKNKLIDHTVYARLKGAESEKSREMLKNTQTQLFDSVEEAINAAVIGVRKNA